MHMPYGRFACRRAELWASCNSLDSGERDFIQQAMFDVLMALITIVAWRAVSNLLLSFIVGCGKCIEDH